MTHHAALPPVFDQTRAEAFLDTVAATLNNGAVAAMISVGHRLGLFDTLASLPPSQSATIAKTAGLAERYVREWLAVMVTGQIVDYAPQEGTYSLPSEHAACLTAGAPFGNLAVYAQSVALFGKVEDRLMQAFRDGEGIPYSDYPCFHQIMSEDSEQTVVAGIGEIIQTLAPDLAERLDQGIDVLDAGCGAGLALIRLAELHPNSRFKGIDLCPDAIEMAQGTAASRGVSNVGFEVRDLSGFDEASAYDLITSFDAVHDTKDPEELLKSYHRALRPGGVHLMQDIGGSVRLENNLDFPFAAFLYAISCSHCTPVSLAQGGKGLGTMWGWETAETMLRQAGFQRPVRSVLPHDPMNVWFVSRKEAPV
ncbi:transcriptional regulator [Leisingera sp. ANG-S5]|nr:transcriptional regulator [Leisingera sp. ANG-S5]